MFGQGHTRLSLVLKRQTLACVVDDLTITPRVTEMHDCIPPAKAYLDYEQRPRDVRGNVITRVPAASSAGC